MWENWKCVCESKGERLYLMYLWIIKIMLHLHFILQYGMYNDIYILYLCSTTRSFVLTRILTSKGRLKRGPFILKLYQTTFKYKFPFFLSYYPLTCNIVCILRKSRSLQLNKYWFILLHFMWIMHDFCFKI